MSDFQTTAESNRIETAIHIYGDMVNRICYLYLKNQVDTEDVFQDVFLKLFQIAPEFESTEHEKAWIIRVTVNRCKDILKSHWYYNKDLTDNGLGKRVKFQKKEESTLLEVVKLLPAKYKDVIYLFYYEDYTVPEIAKIMKKNENTIYSRLHRAKIRIKEQLKEVSEYEYLF